MPSQLSVLLGSETRGAVLANLFLRPDCEMHVRDIVRGTGFSPRAVSKEVDRLASAGLLLERRSSNRRYLRANTTHPLFAPLREILEKTLGIAPALKVALSSEKSITLALIFGSVASGVEKPESDIDLLVVGDVTLKRTIELTTPLQDSFGRAISPIVMTADEFRTRIVDKEHLVTSILDGDRIELIGTLDEFV